MYGKRWLVCDGSPDLLFTENETNNQKLFRRTERHAVREGRNQQLCGERRNRRRESRTDRHQSCGSLPDSGRSWIECHPAFAIDRPGKPSSICGRPKSLERPS